MKALLFVLFSITMCGQMFPGPGGNITSISGSCASLNGFTHCRKLTVDHTKVSSTQSNFTVLVGQTIANLKSTGNGGSVTDAQGDDIVFTSDSGCTTLMSWEIESWSAASGAINAWVLISSLSSSSDTDFYVCYGKNSITTFQGGSLGAAWDSNFKNVYHLSDNAASTTVLDSTSNAANGTNATNTSTVSVAGQIANALNYPNSGDVTTMSTSAFGAGTRNWTICTWVNPDATGGIVYYNTGPGSGLIIDSSMKLHAYSGGEVAPQGATALSSGTWYYACFVNNDGATTRIVYLNGASDGSDASAGLPGDNSSSDLGNTSGSQVGKLDEVRISNSVRTAGWILTEYNNQSSPSTFITVGAET